MGVVFLFLLPVSLNIEGVGVSANYAFLLLLLLPKQLGVGSRLVGITVAYGVICYLVSVLIAKDVGANFYLRQFISFLLFLGPLCIALVRMPFDFMMLARATVWASICYVCVVMVAIVATNTPLTDAVIAKELASWVPDWPQRYIIVVMLAFFLALFLGGQARYWLLAAALSGFCITVSHSRAAIFAMLGAVVLLAMLYWHRRDWHGLRRLILSLTLSLCLVMAFVGNGLGDFLKSEMKRLDDVSALVEKFTNRQNAPPIEPVPDTHDKIDDDLPALAEKFTNRQGALRTERVLETHDKIELISAEGGEVSGKIRIEIWRTITQIMVEGQMWTGSGFAGPYLLEAAIGSAHNQYIDILFRMGPIGLALYLCLWGGLVWRCFGHSPELGCGVLAWFVFGFFNETTKYSYGAFLFFSLLSLARFGWMPTSSKDQDAVRT